MIYLGSQGCSELQLAQEILGNDYFWTSLWLGVSSSVNVLRLCLCADIYYVSDCTSRQWMELSLLLDR